MGAACAKPPPSPPPPKRPISPPRTPPLPSDRVDIVLDRGVDEFNLRTTEDNYPLPLPPGDTREVKGKDQFFDDKEFQLASEDADLFDTEPGKDDVSLSSDLLDEILDKTKNKPKSGSSNVKPIKYGDVDKHAFQADAGVMNSFDDLTQYLVDPWKNDKYRLTKTARAIVMWLSRQDLSKTDLGLANMDTPKGILQYVKEGRMTYTTCYAILCRRAGVKCTVIKGKVKAARYEPGDTSVPNTNWNAVYCEFGWQIIHPFWICKALFGHKLGGWTKGEDGKGTSGINRYTFQERYFMPKPVEFLYECYATDKAWQLVEPERQIKSDEEFLSMPYLLPPFHGLDLQLVSEQNCVLETNNGFCRIEFKGRNTSAHLLLLRYELFRTENDGDKTKVENMGRMVFNSRANEHFIFDIRFTETGVYKLIIYGGPFRLAPLRLCEFKIICKQVIKGYGLLPLSCHYIGWGPGPFTTEAGLLMPSKANGLIPVNKSEGLATEIRFHIRDDYIKNHVYSVALYSTSGGRIDGTDGICGKDSSETSQLMTLSITPELEFLFKLRLPSEGEFGVSIHENVMVKGEYKEKTVCSYLVTTKAYQGGGMKGNIRIAKKSLSEACNEKVRDEDMKKKIKNIETALANCKKQKIPEHDEDVCLAETTKEYLQCKDMLRDCKLRDNLHVTVRALAVMSRYRNRLALLKEVKKVDKLKEEQIKRWQSERR